MAQLANSLLLQLYSEIDPAHINIVHGSMKKLAAMTAALAKLICDCWRDTFAILPGSNTRRFNQQIFPTFLRKTKNLASLVDVSLLEDLTSLQLPSCNVEVPIKPSDKFTCTLPAFVEIHSQLIDSVISAIDTNLMTYDSIQYLKTVHNAEWHIISFALAASQLLSQYPNNFNDALSKCCFEIIKQFKTASESQLLSAIKAIKNRKLSLDPPPNRKRTTSSARLFYTYFTELSKACMDIKSKGGLLTKMANLREIFPTSPTVVDGTKDNGARKSSLPESLLRTLGLDELDDDDALRQLALGRNYSFRRRSTISSIPANVGITVNGGDEGPVGSFPPAENGTSKRRMWMQRTANFSESIDELLELREEKRRLTEELDNLKQNMADNAMKMEVQLKNMEEELETVREQAVIQTARRSNMAEEIAEIVNMIRDQQLFEDTSDPLTFDIENLRVLVVKLIDLCVDGKFSFLRNKKMKFQNIPKRPSLFGEFYWN